MKKAILFSGLLFLASGSQAQNKTDWQHSLISSSPSPPFAPRLNADNQDEVDPVKVRPGYLQRGIASGTLLPDLYTIYLHHFTPAGHGVTELSTDEIIPIIILLLADYRPLAGIDNITK